MHGLERTRQRRGWTQSGKVFAWILHEQDRKIWKQASSGFRRNSNRLTRVRPKRSLLPIHGKRLQPEKTRSRIESSARTDGGLSKDVETLCSHTQRRTSKDVLSPFDASRSMKSAVLAIFFHIELQHTTRSKRFKVEEYYSPLPGQTSGGQKTWPLFVATLAPHIKRRPTPVVASRSMTHDVQRNLGAMPTRLNDYSIQEELGRFYFPVIFLM